jgi:uncharacterized membrane protein
MPNLAFKPHPVEFGKTLGQILRQHSTLLLIVALSVAVLFVSSVARHELFNSSGDLAFFDQGVYLISQNQNPVASILEFHVLADHAAWILYAIALLYKLYPTVYWLFAVQSAALALGAIPAYLLARQAGLTDRQGLVIVGVYLLYPVLYNSNLADFHPDKIAVPALLLAIWAARADRLLWFCLSLIVVLGCKAILSLTVLGLGVWLLLFEKRKIYGVIAIAGGIAWFLIANQWIIPTFGNPAAQVNRHRYRYSYFAATIPETLKLLFSQPQIIFSVLFSRLNLEYLVFLFAPVLWGLRWRYLAPLSAALPCLALNLLSDHPSQKNVILHYSLPILPFLLVALIGCWAAGQTWVQKPRWILVWACVAFLALGKFWFFTSGYLSQLDNLTATQAAIRLVDPQSSVFTTDFIAPHLTHRPLISYKYDEFSQRQEQFQSILINLRHPGWAASQQTYTALVQELQQQPNVQLRYHQDDVFLFTRTSSTSPG